MGEITLGDMRIFRRHADIRPIEGIVFGLQIFRLGDHQATVTEFHVDGFVEIFPLFQQGVLANYAQIGAAIFDIGGHIGGPNRHETKFLLRILKHQLTALFTHLRAGDTDVGKKFHGIFKNAPFRQGKGNPIIHAFIPCYCVQTATRSMRAPTAANFCSMRS